MNAIKIKNLAGECQQAEERVEKLEKCGMGLVNGTFEVINIVLKDITTNTLISLSQGIDRDFFNDTYKGSTVTGIYEENIKQNRYMKDIELDIKKELLEEPLNK